METKEITAVDSSVDHWNVMRQQAEVLVKSGFLPVAINTPEKALAIMQKGKELGIPPMEAMSSINVIQGKPSVSPQLMLALARRTGELEDLKMESNDKGATVTIKRKDQSPYTTSFGIKEATDLQLIGKDNYKKQAATMFQWRALAANLRVTFPDAISGLYLVEEMTQGDEVSVTATLNRATAVQMPKALEPVETKIEQEPKP